jgi:hypothetical protein
MLILALIVAAAAVPEGKPTGMDDWQALTVIAVGKVSSDGSPYYLRVAAGDLDGDGLPDEAYLKLDCANGLLKEASYMVKGPRDSGSGMATGKRMHKPFTFVKEWGAPSSQLSTMRPTYNVKKMEGARSAIDDWTALSLSKAEGLCPATAAAIVKSKSNISNN